MRQPKKIWPHSPRVLELTLKKLKLMKTLLSQTVYLAIPANRNIALTLAHLEQEQIHPAEESAHRYVNSQNYSLSNEQQLVVKPAQLIVEIE